MCGIFWLECPVSMEKMWLGLEKWGLGAGRKKAPPRPFWAINTLEVNLNKDIILGHTSFGVHRDDFDFIFNDKIADGSASRGEGRTVILALKFIEANMINNLLNEKPIILLDDVFSELDETRRRFLVKNFKDNQIILTSVENIKLDY